MASGACCSHDHDCEAASCGEASLHRFVNHVGVTCLNATNADDAPRVLRPWDERRLRVGALESEDDDPELLLHVPFTTDVKACRGWLAAQRGVAAAALAAAT